MLFKKEVTWYPLTKQVVVGILLILPCEPTVADMIQILEPLKVGDSHTSSISKHVWNDQHSAVMKDSLSSNGSRSIGSFSNYLIGVYYRMAGNFRGSQFSRLSRLTGDPRKLNPRNKKPKRTRARAITGGRGHRGAYRCSTAGLLHTSSLLLSFFCTNVSSLDHMLLSCHFSISAKYKYDQSIACCFFRPIPTRYEPRRACSKRWSRTDIVGGGTLERPSAKIRSRNL